MKHLTNPKNVKFLLHHDTSCHSENFNKIGTVVMGFVLQKYDDSDDCAGDVVIVGVMVDYALAQVLYLR